MENSKSIALREGGLGDFPAVEFVLRSLPKYYVEDAIPRIFEDLHTCQLVLAEVDSETVGFMAWRDTDTTTTELLWMAVLPRFWSEGIGTRLTQYAIGKSHHSSRVFLRTASPDSVIEGTSFDGAAYVRTIQFFEYIGFVKTEVLRDYWGPGNHCLVMDYATGESEPGLRHSKLSAQ